MIIFQHSVPEFLSQLVSEPSLTVAFGLTLIFFAGCLRHFNRLSHETAEEHKTVELKGAEGRLGNIAEIEFQIPSAALLNSTPQIQSELRQ